MRRMLRIAVAALLWATAIACLAATIVPHFLDRRNHRRAGVDVADRGAPAQPPHAVGVASG